MKKIIILLIFFLTINISYANTINEYTLDLVAEIIAGNDDGELGWNKELADMWGGCSRKHLASASRIIFIYAIYLTRE